MTELNVYLTFNGNCREAMEFYHSVFGGELSIIPFGETEHGAEMPAEDSNKVMHASIHNNKLVLMASDTSSQHPAVTTGSSISLSLNCGSEQEIDEYFYKLCQDGHVTMTLQDTFWGAKFGMLNDKFGIPWMLNFDKPK